MASPLPFQSRIPFVEHLGMELHAFGDGKAELRLLLDEPLTNNFDVAHGGVVMSLLDVAMAQAARSGSAENASVVTIEMKTSFMRPAEGALRSLGTLLHKTATMAFCEASLLDGHGRLCAHATGTFKYIRALPGKARGSAPGDQEKR